METNKSELVIEITNLCNKLLNKDANVSDTFFKLYSLLDNFSINEDLKSFCSLIIDETAWIPPKEKKELCSEELIKKIQKEEAAILEFYENDIKNIATQIINEISNQKSKTRFQASI